MSVTCNKWVGSTDTYTKEGLLHIQSHFIIIETHDPDETFEGADLNGDWRVLRRFTNNLHDVVSLALKADELLDHEKIKKIKHTSLLKFSRTNSRELNKAEMAAYCTSVEGSSFLAPWMTAVKISLDRRLKISGF